MSVRVEKRNDLICTGDREQEAFFEYAETEDPSLGTSSLSPSRTAYSTDEW